MAIVSMLTFGYNVAAFPNKTLSAQMPTGNEAFSWLAPDTISPLFNSAMAPTKKFEYGAYACRVTARALLSKFASLLFNSVRSLYSWYSNSNFLLFMDIRY